MEILRILGIMLLGYLIGSVPFGFILVKLLTGKDIRDVQSGRTGGTNAMRAAGLWVGIGTGILDALKTYGSVLLANWLVPGNHLMAALTPAAAVLGHNYSIFLAQRDKKGKLFFGGGAGGAPVLGGSMGLWPPSFLIILPAGILIYYFVGYASVTTLSVGVMSLIIFSIRAVLGLSPGEYVIYAVLGLFLLTWALRPNIKRLREGNERMHGYRTRKKTGEKTKK
ncbi:MAG: glycerol-3-phosphate acyltransferase [Anaerolineales bacterium]